MPLKKGKKNIESNIHEMSHSEGHEKRVKMHGKKTAHKMEVAASMRMSGIAPKRKGMMM